MKKNNKIFFIISLTILAALFFCVVLIHAVFYAPVDEINLPIVAIPAQKFSQAPITPQILTSKNTAEDYTASYPKILRIPSIKVKAKIQYVGVTKNGKMATPNNFTDVGWFRYGTIPGEVGSAIIAGHVDDGLSFPAVFADLGNMNVGDDVYIDTVSGSTIHFKVINIKTYDPNAKTEEIFNQNDGNFLKLITCAGVWSELYKTHNQRLVVTAEQV
jgi:LPXTG-site transpeptidase (sortase) family protein